MKKVSSDDAISLLDTDKDNYILYNNSNQESFIAISLFAGWFGYQLMFYGSKGEIKTRTFWGGNGFSEWRII